MSEQLPSSANISSPLNRTVAPAAPSHRVSVARAPVSTQPPSSSGARSLLDPATMSANILPQSPQQSQPCTVPVTAVTQALQQQQQQQQQQQKQKQQEIASKQIVLRSVTDKPLSATTASSK